MFYAIMACEYGIRFALNSFSNFYARYNLVRCTWYLLLFLLGEIIPFILILKYLYTLQEVSDESFFAPQVYQEERRINASGSNEDIFI